VIGVISSIVLLRDSNLLIHLDVYSKTLGILPALLYGALLLAVCFVTRPSILQKNCQYLRAQFRKIFLYWLLLLPLYMSYSPWYIFFVLFFADSEGGFKSFLYSMWNALKMIVYNLPLIFIISFCLGIPVVVFKFIFFVNPLIYSVASVFLMPITVCTYTNIYVKKLHDQFDLYFNRAQ
jgi:small-conductance mechanosensitive channel